MQYIYLYIKREMPFPCWDVDKGLRNDDVEVVFLLLLLHASFEIWPNGGNGVE